MQPYVLNPIHSQILHPFQPLFLIFISNYTLNLQTFISRICKPPYWKFLWNMVTKKMASWTSKSSIFIPLSISLRVLLEFFESIQKIKSTDTSTNTGWECDKSCLFSKKQTAKATSSEAHQRIIQNVEHLYIKLVISFMNERHDLLVVFWGGIFHLRKKGGSNFLFCVNYFQLFKKWNL